MFSVKALVMLRREVASNLKYAYIFCNIEVETGWCSLGEHCVIVHITLIGRFAYLH